MFRLWGPPPVRYVVSVLGRPGLRVRASEWVGVRHWASFYLRHLNVHLDDIYIEDVESGCGPQPLASVLTDRIGV